MSVEERPEGGAESDSVLAAAATERRDVRIAVLISPVGEAWGPEAAPAIVPFVPPPITRPTMAPMAAPPPTLATFSTLLSRETSFDGTFTVLASIGYVSPS